MPDSAESNAPVRRGRRPRRWIRALVIAAAAVAVIGGLFRVPAVQRWIVLELFPSGPGAAIEIGDVSAGLRTFEVNGLHVDWHGLRVAIDHAEARFGLVDLVASKTARLDRLHVTGLVVDLRDAAPRDSGDRGTPREPFVFRGLRPFAQLPLNAVVTDLDVDAEILLPAAPGTTHLTAHLSGRDIAPGATGELDATVGLTVEQADVTHAVFAGHGSVRVHQTLQGLLDRVAFQGDVRPADPGARGERGLAARAGFEIAAAEEAYRLALATPGAASRDVLALTATRRPADGHVAGSWTAHLGSTQVMPFLGDLVPPEFALTGSGSFETDPAARVVEARSTFDASAARWERLHPALAAIGPLRFEGEAATSLSGGLLTVKALGVRVSPPGAPPVLDAAVEQPFDVRSTAPRVVPSDRTAPLARLRLQGLPLAWIVPPGTAVNAAQGTLTGAIEFALPAPGDLRLRTPAPIVAAGVRVVSPSRGELGPFTVGTGLEATLTPSRIEARLDDLTLETAKGARLDFDGSVSMARDGLFAAELEGALSATLPGLTALVPEIKAVRARGRFGLDVPSMMLSVREAELAIEGAGKGSRLATGTLTTVRPLEVDLRDVSPDWTQFEPATFALEIDGFPIAWISRFLPQLRIASGTLHGSFRATVSSDRAVHIAGREPFELRGANVYWGDLQVLDGARLEVTPSIRLSRASIETVLERIAFRDAAGNLFDGRLRVRATPKSERHAGFDVALRVLAPSLTDRIGRLGEFNVRGSGLFDRPNQTLEIESAAFDCRDTEGRPYLEGTSLQPFAIGLAPFHVAEGRNGPRLFRATFIPLELEKVFPEALGFSFSGPLPAGDAIVEASEGGLLIHAVRPLEFGPVSVKRNGLPFLDGVTMTMAPEITYTATGIRSKASRIAVTAKGKRLVEITNRSEFEIVGVTPRRSIALQVDVELPALSGQPVFRDLAGFKSGRLQVTTDTSFVPRLSRDIRLTFSEAVLVDGSRVPDLAAQVRIDEETGGGITIDAPLRLLASGRTSDVTARGHLVPEADGYRLDLAVDSERLVLDDVALLAQAIVPAQPDAGARAPGAAVPARESPALARFVQPGGGAFWKRLRGRVPVRLHSVEFDRYAIEGARATLESTDTRLALTDLGARLLGATLDGHLSMDYDGSSARPYTVDAALSVADIDLARIFTTVDPSKKPTLEGRFGIDSRFHSTDADPLAALVEIGGEIRVTGESGLFRGLQKRAGTASSMVQLVGALTFSKELKALGRVIGRLDSMPFHEFLLVLDRDPARGLLLKNFDLRGENVIVHGEGAIKRERDVPFVDRELRVRMDLSARGDAAVIFAGMGLLEKKQPVTGFRPLSKPFEVGGTVGSPDPEALYRLLDESAANATGAFGAAFRKGMKMVGSYRAPAGPDPR